MKQAAANIVEIGDDEPNVRYCALSHGEIAQLALRLRLNQRSETEPGPDRGVPRWMLDLATQSRRNAKVRGIEYALVDADLVYLVKRCAGQCEVSGIVFSSKRSGPGKRAPFRASLDRIDASQGYHRNNVRVVCTIVNLAMNEWGVSPLRQLVEAMHRRLSL